MTDIQFDIIDKLYFVEPYQTLLNEIDAPESIIRSELKELIQKGWVQIMKFDEKVKDFLPTPFLNVDDLKSCYFLATKEGLLKHHLK